MPAFIIKNEAYPPSTFRMDYDVELGEWVVYEGKQIVARCGQNWAAAKFLAQAANEKRDRAMARDVLVIVKPSINVFSN